MSRSAGALLWAAVLLAPAPAAAQELHLVTVHARDSGFEAPTRVPSGATTLRFVNRGWQPHRMLLLRLDPGVEEADLRAALPLAAQPIAGVASLGGTSVQRGEGTEDLSVALRAGRYALVCDVHEAGAEIHELQVMEYETATLPPGEWSALLEDDGLVAPAALPAGTRWLRVENRGTRLHGLELVRLRPGRSGADARAWLRAPSGPAPWVRAGGTAPLSPGEAVLVEVALSPGDYVLFAPGPGEGGGRPDGPWHALAVRAER